MVICAVPRPPTFSSGRLKLRCPLKMLTFSKPLNGKAPAGAPGAIPGGVELSVLDLVTDCAAAAPNRTAASSIASDVLTIKEKTGASVLVGFIIDLPLFRRNRDLELPGRVFSLGQQVLSGRQVLFLCPERLSAFDFGLLQFLPISGAYY